MVFKPSETTPLCALKVAEILIEVSTLRAFITWCRAREVGAQLATHDDIAGIADWFGTDGEKSLWRRRPP